MSSPTVSVVVPAWNAERWIGRAVRSALAQTLPPLEVIVADDGSTDGTAEAAAIAPQVRVLRLPHRGQAAATNAAIREARGEWIAILHADDEWLPEKTAAQLAALRRLPQAGVIYCDLLLVDPSGAELGRFLPVKRHAADGWVFDALVEQCFVLPSATLIRRSLFTEEGLRFPEDLEVALDYELWLLAARRHPFLRVDAALVRRTLLPGAASTRDAALHEDHVVLMRRLRDRLIADGSPTASSLPRLTARLSRAEIIHGLDRFRGGDVAGARRELTQSVRHRPSAAGVWWWLFALLGGPARPLLLRLTAREASRERRAAATATAEASGSRVLGNIASGWGQFAITIAAGLFLTPFVIHRAGDAAYGVLILVEAILGYSEFLYLGLGSAVSRYAARFRGERDLAALRTLGGTVLALYLGCGALLAAVVLMVAPVVPRLFDLSPDLAADAVLAVRVLGLTTAIAFPASAFSGLLRGHERITTLNAIKIAELVLRVTLLVWLLRPEHALRTLVLVGAGTGIAGALCRVVAAIPVLGFLPNPRAFSREMLRRIAGFSLFSFLIDLAERVLFKTDGVLIGAFLPVNSITSYAVPGRLVEYSRQLLLRVREALQPRFALLAVEPGGAAAFLPDAGRWGTLLGLPLVSIVVFGGPAFLEVWIGEPFLESGVILACLGAAQLVRAPGYACEAALWGTGRVAWLSGLLLIEATANLGLSITLIGRHGITGAAVGTLVPALALSALVMPWVACRATGASLTGFLVQAWGRPLLAAIPMVAVHAMLRPVPGTTWTDFIWRIGAGVLAYLAAAWWVGLYPHERHRLVHLLTARRRMSLSRSQP